jgi:protein-tyrosine phosphatase
MTKDGKTVKWGRIYRSGEINNLTAADLDTMENRHINYVMDFRGPAEVATAPDKLPRGAVRVSLPYGSKQVGDKGRMMQVMATASTGDSIMLPFYAQIAPFAQRYKPVFTNLLNNSDDSALLFHCSAGKDHTGIGAALVLYALGVDHCCSKDKYVV